MYKLAHTDPSLEDRLNQSEWQIQLSFAALAHSRECVRASERAIKETRKLLAKHGPDLSFSTSGRFA